MRKRVRVTYLRGKMFELGDVLCWLDDDREKEAVVSWWKIEKMFCLLSFTGRELTLAFSPSPLSQEQCRSVSFLDVLNVQDLLMV